MSRLIQLVCGAAFLMHWAAQSDLVMSHTVDTRALHCQSEGRQLAGWCEDEGVRVWQ